MLSKIFNWKVFSILYLLFFIITTIINIAYFDASNMLFPNIEMILNIFGLFVSVVGIGYCFANGWKVQLFSKKFSIVFAVIFFLLFPIVFLYNSFYFGVMNDGDFLTAVITSSITLVMQALILLPVFVAYCVYIKNYKEFSCIEKGVHKIISSYLTVNVFCMLIAIILFKNKNFLLYNAFDYLNIFLTLAVIPFIVCYAWNRRLSTLKFCKAFSVLFVISEILSYMFMSSQWKTDFYCEGATAGILVSLVITLYVIFVLYKYSFTDEIFRNEQN